MRYALSTLAGAAALAISLIAGPAMAEDDGIIVYNAQHEALTQAWADGFTKETGIKVTAAQWQRHRARQPDRRRKAQPRRPTCS